MHTEARANTLSAPARWFLLTVAGVFLILGVIGLFLPVMPTVPFLVVSAWCASRSSPRLHRWLLSHPRFGHLLTDWYEAGIVPRRAKWITTVMMAGSSVSMLVVSPDRYLPVVFGIMAIMAIVLVWLWRRPEDRPGASPV
jgi:uncharacterized protein